MTRCAAKKKQMSHATPILLAPSMSTVIALASVPTCRGEQWLLSRAPQFVSRAFPITQRHRQSVQRLPRTDVGWLVQPEKHSRMKTVHERVLRLSCVGFQCTPDLGAKRIRHCVQADTPERIHMRVRSPETSVIKSARAKGRTDSGKKEKLRIPDVHDDRDNDNDHSTSDVSVHRGPDFPEEPECTGLGPFLRSEVSHHAKKEL